MIGQKLLMPVVKDVGQIINEERERKKLDSISLPISAVENRIIDMSNDVLEQIASQVTLLHLMQCNWTNLLILQAYQSFLFLFDILAAGSVR